MYCGTDTVTMFSLQEFWVSDFGFRVSNFGFKFWIKKGEGRENT